MTSVAAADIAETDNQKYDHRDAPSHWRRYLVQCAVAVIFFCTSSPKSAPSVLVLVGFMVFGMFLHGFTSLIFAATGLRRIIPTTYYRGIVLTIVCLPVLLLILQSIGQLTLRDILTLGGLFLVGALYVAKLRSTIKTG